MKKLLILVLILFVFICREVKANPVYTANAVWIQDGSWPRLNPYILSANLTKVLNDLSKNNIKYAIVMVGYYDGSSPTDAVEWQRTTTGFSDGGPPNATFYTSIVNALHTANITAIAWIEDEYGAINVSQANWGNLESQINQTLQWGFDGYSDDIESTTGTTQDYINWINNATVWLHSLNKLSMPAVGYDWQQNINPYLHVDYIVTMFYGGASLLDPSNGYSKDVEAYWQEEFGEYGQNTPPASPVLIGIQNFYGNTYPLVWQLNRLDSLLAKYGHPQLAGFSIWLYEYMGTNPTDWNQWNYWINHVNNTTFPNMSVLNITTSPLSGVPITFEGTNLYKLPYNPFSSPETEYLFNGTMTITAPSQAIQEINYPLFGDSDHNGGSEGYDSYTYAGGPYNLTTSSSVSSLYFYCMTTGNVKLAIYNATYYYIDSWKGYVTNDGYDYHPYALLTHSNATACTANSWVLVNVPIVTLSAGIYFIAIKGDTSGIIGVSALAPQEVGGDAYGYDQFISEYYGTAFDQVFPTVEGSMGDEPSVYVSTAPMLLTNYTFSHWEDAETTLTRTVNINGNATITAYYTTNSTISKISGTLKDKSNNPVKATIIAYDNGTNTMIGLAQTNSSGYYSLEVPNGTYDVQFNPTNFFISGYSIKLNSINLTNDTYNIIQTITGNQSANTVSIVLDINNSQSIQIYSPNAPTEIKKNNTYISSVSSLSQLANNTWFYQSPNLYLMISPEFIVNAKSGSAADIQAAVNQVAAAGGGTVYIPEGNFTWHGETVTIPGGVNVIGDSYAGCMGHENNWTSYNATTILHNNAAQKASGMPDMFYVGGMTHGQYTNKPVRISGIRFEATPPANPNDEGNQTGVAIDIVQIPNFRVDHCTFVNFANQAVFADANDGWHGTNVSCYGVIDHCVQTNPYKLINNTWAWAYGFYARGDAASMTNWILPVTSFFGQYGWRWSYTMMFVEDSHLSYFRHATDAMEGGYVVNRFNLMDYPACEYWIGMSDVHGNMAGGWLAGGRGQEVYNDTFVAWPDVTSGHVTEYPWIDASVSAFQLRGGAGLCYNNKYIGNGDTGESAAFVTLSNGDDYIGSPSMYYWSLGMDVNQTYIWNNTYTNAPFMFFDYRNLTYNWTQNVNYFLRAPNQAQDGFTYTPYPYPHPLTLNP